MEAATPQMDSLKTLMSIAEARAKRKSTLPKVTDIVNIAYKLYGQPEGVKAEIARYAGVPEEQFMRMTDIKPLIDPTQGKFKWTPSGPTVEMESPLIQGDILSQINRRQLLNQETMQKMILARQAADRADWDLARKYLRDAADLWNMQQTQFMYHGLPMTPAPNYEDFMDLFFKKYFNMPVPPDEGMSIGQPDLGVQETPKPKQKAPVPWWDR
jgi:hypothetical protein